MAKGVIDFVEPNDSKKHIKREFIMRKLMKFTIPVPVLNMENESI